MSSTTITVETLNVTSGAQTLPRNTGKLRYVPAGHSPLPSPHNFHLPAISEFGDIRSVPLHNMRPVPSVKDLHHRTEHAQLFTHGFTAVHHPSAMHCAPYSLASWKTPKLLSQIYIPETEEMVKQITGAKTVVTEGLLLRSQLWSEADALASHAGHGSKHDNATATEKLYISAKSAEEEPDLSTSFPQFIGFSPTAGGASPAPKIHLDYSPSGARTHLRRYHPRLTTAASSIIDAEDRLTEAGADLPTNYGSRPDCPRWAMFSIWRPLKRVRRDPLALGDARTFHPEDFVPVVVKTPNLGIEGDQSTHYAESYLARYSEGHKWYWVDGMRPEEVLVIGLFDSEKEREDPVAGGGTLHSSVDLDEVDEAEEARESIELRCLAIW